MAERRAGEMRAADSSAGGNRAIRPPIFTEAGGNGKSRRTRTAPRRRLKRLAAAAAASERGCDLASILAQTTAEHARTCPALHP